MVRSLELKMFGIVSDMMLYLRTLNSTIKLLKMAILLVLHCYLIIGQ